MLSASSVVEKSLLRMNSCSGETTLDVGLVKAGFKLFVFLDSVSFIKYRLTQFIYERGAGHTLTCADKSFVLGEICP